GLAAAQLSVDRIGKNFRPPPELFGRFPCKSRSRSAWYLACSIPSREHEMSIHVYRRFAPMQKARWSTAVAAVALLALPVAASAQSTQSTPQQNPPAQQSQPPSS